MFHQYLSLCINLKKSACGARGSRPWELVRESSSDPNPVYGGISRCRSLTTSSLSWSRSMAKGWQYHWIYYYANMFLWYQIAVQKTIHNHHNWLIRTFVIISFEKLFCETITIMNQNRSSRNINSFSNFEVFCMVVIFHIFHLQYVFHKMFFSMIIFILVIIKLACLTFPLDKIESGLGSKLLIKMHFWQLANAFEITKCVF